MRKIAIVVLLFVMLLQGAACNGAPSGGPSGGVVIWTADANEKITQETSEAYRGMMQQNSVNVIAARNEYEGGQIILTAEKAVESYDVLVSDLKAADGTEYAAENIAIYHEKYYFVSSGKDYYTQVGYFPDCLLPFELAKQAGENRVEADRNQGVYLSFFVPAEQEAGVYTGSIQIVADGTVNTVPVSLTVYGATVSEEVHADSAFSLAWYLWRGELDTTLDMRMEYAEFLAEYRLSGYDIFRSLEFKSPAEIEKYIDTVTALAKEPKIASLKLRALKRTVSDYTVDGVNYGNVKVSVLDEEAMADFMVAFAERSFEEGFDILSKLFIYEIDEPELNGFTANDLTAFGESVRLTKERAVNTLNANRTRYNADPALFDAVIKSIEEMPNIVTCNSDWGELSHTTYCPYFSNVNNPTDLSDFQESSFSEIWWYGCNVPNSPYPTYHIGDTLLSARLASWMQYDYNIAGNLYWAVDYYPNDSENYYTENGSYLIEGEGVLTYPGKPYGAEGPLPSMRLEAIRDGLEEYELLRSLELMYNESGFSSKNVRKYLTESLYTGSRVNTTNEYMLASRKGLYELVSLAESKAGLKVTDIEVQNGSYRVEVYANDGYVPESSGVPMQLKNRTEGGAVYECTITTSAEVNGIEIGVTIDGVRESFSWYLGGSAMLTTGETLMGMLKERNAVLDASVVDASSFLAESEIDETTEGEYVHLGLGSTMNNAASKKVQDVLLEGDAIGSIGENTKRVVIRIYNDSDENQYFRLEFKYSRDDIFTTMLTQELVPGMNTIEFNNVFTYNWNLLGTLEQLRFIFGNADGSPELTHIYMKDIAVYAK